MTLPTIWCKKIETYVKLPHFCDKLVETELKDIFLFRSNSLKVLIFTSYGWSISENGMMSANISRDSQYFHHISLKYLRWATFVLSLKVAAFIILEKSRGAFSLTLVSFISVNLTLNVLKNHRSLTLLLQYFLANDPFTAQLPYPFSWLKRYITANGLSAIYNVTPQK